MLPANDMTPIQAPSWTQRLTGRLHCDLVFLAAGVGIGAWASSLPLVAAAVGLNKGELGLVLLCFALGAIILMINVGRYIDRVVGNETLSLCGGVVFGAAFLVIPFVTDPILLGGCVLVAGAAFGTLDVAMNTGASKIEQASGRHLMSSFHALFSIGNLVGALLVGQVISHGGGLLACLGGAGALVILLSVAGRGMAKRTLDSAPVSTVDATAQSMMLNTSQKAIIFMLGAIAFLALFAEGSMMDWTAIYMTSVIGSSDSHAAYAFAVFAAAMAGGRFVGDSITRRIGRVRLILAGGLICAASIAILLISNSVAICFAALALCGVGVANIVPAVFASAGSVGGKAAGKAISIVTTMGYSGLLLGPALLGFLAHATSLVVSFALILLAFLVIAGMTVQLDRRLGQFRLDR